MGRAVASRRPARGPLEAGPAGDRAGRASGHRGGARGLPIGRSWAADFRV